MKYKYLILFPIPNPYKDKIIALMDHIESLTGIPAPHKKIIPHMTFHSPIKELSAERILSLTESMVLQISQTRIVTNNLFAFGKQYIVLPAHATRGVASLWVGINDLLTRLPHYEHGPYDYENTLHITIANHMFADFDWLWPKLQNEPTEVMEIPVQIVEVWKKGLEEGQQWQKIKDYELPLFAFKPK